MNATIYVVDDDPAVLSQFESLFKRSGYEVKAYSNPLELAPAVSETFGAVVIVSDMRMPKMTGLDLMIMLRQMNILHPIVFVSGESTPEEIVAAHKDAGVTYVLKPVMPRELLAAVERAAALDLQRRDATRNAMKLVALEERLTPTEKRIYKCLLKSMSIKEIAAETGLKADTIKKHRQAIFNKLKCYSVYGLLKLTGTV